ncbi:MAG: hypothetical protein D6726_05685 [Nitrospirae bacterium]|nr:MAG: hypothetical protein D6726_05685 [Nitrospirota bacterium]
MRYKREIAAIVFIPLFYIIVMKSQREVFLFFTFLLTCLALWEFYAMYNVINAQKIIGTVGAGVLQYSFYIGSSGLAFSVIIFTLLLMLLARLFSTSRDPSGAMNDVGPAVTGFFYIPMLLGILLLIRRAGPVWILFLAVVVWASDSAAYYVGKRVGKRKLYPAMSPKKTVEGAIGSVVGGVLSALLMKVVFVEDLGLLYALILGAITGGVTILGDLVESMFKRDAGVKDSSHLIPGHGGVLDKIDGFLFVIPMFYLFLITFVY